MDCKTVQGRERGFGWCEQCGNTWNWKHGFKIPINGCGSSYFPVCRDCAAILTDEILLLFVAGHLREYPGEDTSVDYARKCLELWHKYGREGEDPTECVYRLELEGRLPWKINLRTFEIRLHPEVGDV